MKAPHLTKLLALFAVLALTVTAFSAVPRTINYQGYIKSSDGTPVDAAIVIRFTLYSSNPARSNPVWSETKMITPANGIYKTQLGSSVPISASFDVPYLLGVKVAGDAEMALQELSSVPYALRALQTNNVNSDSQIVSTVPAGTAPLSVTSTTVVANLNADMVDTKHAVDFVDRTSDQTIGGTKTYSNSINGNISGNAETVTNGIYNGGNNSEISIGTFSNYPFSLIANNVQALRIEPNSVSPNIIGGYNGNSVTAGAYGATIGGGGGSGNVNRVSDIFGTVSGGINNHAGDNSGTFSDRGYATISGGLNNTASGYGSMVGGGDSNTANGADSFVGGGYTNTAGGSNSAVPGGSHNVALGQNSLAAGTASQALHDNTFVWSGGLPVSSTAPGQFLISAPGGAGINKNNPVSALDVNGTVTATQFSGGGAGLSSITASALAAGTYPAAVSFTSSSNTFTGGGSGLTGLNAGNISTGQLAIARGGTNSVTVGAAGSTPYSTGSAYAFSTAGTSGQLLLSGGTGAPTWGAVNLTSATQVVGTLPIANGGTGSSTQNFVDLSTSQTIGGTKTFSSTITGSISGNAATVTNGVYVSGSYANPSWIASLAGSKISGDISVGNLALPATTATTGIIRSGGYTLIHSFGAGNFFAGLSAGNLTTTGSFNSASGVSSLSANTSGYNNTASGAYALTSNMTGSDNVASGVSVLRYNISGSDNTAIGNFALYSNTSGGLNTANGYYALLNNTIGSRNTAGGYSSLNANTSASQNTGIGDGALYTQSYSNGGTSWNSDNTAVGHEALYLNQPSSTANGLQNTAIGSMSLHSNITGLNNTALGYAAGYNQTTGSNNTYIGYNVAGVAGENNTIRIGNGTSQTYIAGNVNAGGFSGDGSGLTNVGASNMTGMVSIANGGTGSSTKNFIDLSTSQTIGGTKTFSSTIAGSISGNAGTVTNGVYTSGSYANPVWITSLAGTKITGDLSINNLTLPVTTTTTGQIKVGTQLFIHTTGQDNTFMGIGTPSLYTTGTSNTAMGSQSLSSNTSGSQNTAIGYRSLYNNQFGAFNTAMGYNSLSYNGAGGSNTAIGSNSLSSNSAGNNNTAVGLASLGGNTTGVNNTAIGSSSLTWNTLGIYNTGLGYNAGTGNVLGTHSTYVGALAGAAVDGLMNSTAIGFGARVNASNKVRVGDTNVFVIEGNVAWSNPSDMRLKKDVAKATLGLDFIKSLRPVEFRMKDGNDRKDFGFIAQEIEALIGTDYNVLGIGADPERTLSLRYTDFIAPMVKAVQEQQVIIESQKEKILFLEERLALIENLLGSK